MYSTQTGFLQSELQLMVSAVTEESSISMKITASQIQ